MFSASERLKMILFTLRDSTPFAGTLSGPLLGVSGRLVPRTCRISSQLGNQEGVLETLNVLCEWTEGIPLRNSIYPGQPKFESFVTRW